MYKLINFTELASDALLYTLNDIHKDYINFTKETKELFRYNLNKLIKSKITFGKKTIIVSTCAPINNWRKADRGRGIKGYRYSLTNDSTWINIDKLNLFLQSYYNKIEKYHNCITISHKELDISDIFWVIAVELNLDLISCTTVPKYLLIKDSNNYTYENHIPSYLILDIENMMVEKGLL
jgi:hypothetical protein